jgi:hypothetical protein
MIASRNVALPHGKVRKTMKSALAARETTAIGRQPASPRTAERTVRVAERQGQLMVEMVQAALRDVDLSPEQASAFKAALARQVRELTASP